MFKFIEKLFNGADKKPELNKRQKEIKYMANGLQRKSKHPDNIELKRHIDDCTNIYERILWLFENEPYTRNSKRYLLGYYYYRSGKVDVQDEKISLSDLLELPSQETILRDARHIQNTLGLYPPTNEVKRKRRQKSQEHKRKFSKY